jgi:hypothetical protein
MVLKCRRRKNVVYIRDGGNGGGGDEKKNTRNKQKKTTTKFGDGWGLGGILCAGKREWSGMTGWKAKKKMKNWFDMTFFNEIF